MPKITADRRKALELEGVEKARQTRRSLGLGITPISDLFGLLEQHGLILLRYPSNHPKLNAFYAQIKGYEVAYINSNQPLGRQLFSGAHEFYHFNYDKHNLILCNTDYDKEEDNENEVIANAFAAEFLMPEEGIQAAYLRNFGKLYPKEIHCIHMQQIFKVSYGAIVYALYKAGIILKPAFYGKLKKIGNIENTDELKILTKKLGYPARLIDSTSSSIPHNFYQALKDNYEEGIISFGKLESMLEIWGKTPQEFGFEEHEL